MKLWLKVVLIIFAVIAVSVTGFAIWQKDNIQSLITSFKYSDEEIEAKIEENKKNVEKLVESLTDSQIRDFTFEEEEQIRKGEITVEQAIEKIIYESSKKNSDSGAEENHVYSQPHQQSAETVDIDSIVSKQISKMYQLKAYYISRLGDLERKSVAEYTSLPNEKRGAAARQSVISKYMGEAVSLERECDSKVNEALNYLQTELKKYGRDLEVVKNIRKAYENEKVLKKSYYLNAYK